jgi:hypothetical protein
MTRRSSGAVRQLVPQVGDDWQDEETERDAVPDQEAEADEDEAGDAETRSAPVDLDEGDDLIDADPDLLAAGDGSVAVAADPVDALLASLDSTATRAARPGTRRAAGNARRQLEEYWEQRRMARELEDLEDFEV